MIRYALKCIEEHAFESWFQSADTYEKLSAAHLVTCPVCGDCNVQKAIMAPQLHTARKIVGEMTQTPPERPGTHALTAPSSAAEKAMNELKTRIQENCDYVGENFADEARKIHDGDAPERSIYGEASGEEAQKLVDDGVPVAPLPFIPTRKAN